MALFIKDRDKIASISKMKKARQVYNETLDKRKPYLAVPFAFPLALTGYIENILVLFCSKRKIDEITAEYMKITDYVSRT